VHLINPPLSQEMSGPGLRPARWQWAPGKHRTGWPG